MYDKEKLFRFRRVSKVNIYNIGYYEDYFYGYMADHAGYVKYFDLKLYDEGFVLELPTRKNPSVISAFRPEGKIFQVQKESQEWAEKMDISYVGDLNDHITKEGISNILLVQEALQEAKISDIAQRIVLEGNKKFIMIAGPSSSGKTSFSHRLSIQLLAHGMKPHPIGVDNYFKNREETPLDEYGEKNYECLEAIDVEQFNKDMLALLRGERIELPVFNFKTGHREYKGDFLQLGPEDVLVIEGIHGLNDKLSYALPAESKFKIYISALTQLNMMNITAFRLRTAGCSDGLYVMQEPEELRQKIRLPDGRLYVVEKKRTSFHIRSRQMSCLIQHLCMSWHALKYMQSHCYLALIRANRSIWRQNAF